MLLQETTGASTTTYVYGLGLISTTDGSANQTYYLQDGLGNTVALCNGSGTVTATYTYDVFGAIRSHTGTGTTEFTFTGEQNDPNGLEYLRARYYDNATGRFLSGDPLGSGYGYAGGNPANRVDPTGLSAAVPTGAGDAGCPPGIDGPNLDCPGVCDIYPVICAGTSPPPPPTAVPPLSAAVLVAVVLGPLPPEQSVTPDPTPDLSTGIAPPAPTCMSPAGCASGDNAEVNVLTMTTLVFVALEGAPSISLTEVSCWKISCAKAAVHGLTRHLNPSSECGLSALLAGLTYTTVILSGGVTEPAAAIFVGSATGYLTRSCLR
jgi:RHS repeat-associated protein